MCPAPCRDYSVPQASRLAPCRTPPAANAHATQCAVLRARPCRTHPSRKMYAPCGVPCSELGHVAHPQPQMHTPRDSPRPELCQVALVSRLIFSPSNAPTNRNTPACFTPQVLYLLYTFLRSETPRHRPLASHQPRDDCIFSVFTTGRSSNKHYLPDT